jgi:TonB family protein
MPALTLSNLLLFAAQAALLIGALALVLAALRPTPAFRLAACRGVLLVLLVLPWQAILRTPAPRPRPIAVADGPARAVDAVDVHATRSIPWGAIAGGVVAAGILLRLFWLGAGLIRLSRLTRRLPEAETTDEIADLQSELGTQARVHFAPDIAQPVTFGVAPPIVLLPAALRDAAAEQRLAVICHELLHVRRRDWPWVLVEEAVLALLWFHPAVWWLVGELQLAREQVVDRLTVAATGARRAYMDALFSAADTPSAPPVFAQFLRRRHLARRLVALAEEVVMSRARLAVGGVLVLGVLAASSAVALAAWPLVPAPGGGGQQPDRMVFQAKLDSQGLLAVVSRADVEMPDGLAGELTESTIVVDLVLDAGGNVTAVRPVSFLIVKGGNGAQISATGLGALDEIMAKVAARQTQAGAPAPFADRAAVIRDLDAMLKAASAALTRWKFGPPAASPAIARVSTRFDLAAGGVTVAEPKPISGFSGAAAAPTSTFVANPPQSSFENAIRVGGNIRAPQKAHHVSPVYPQVAQDAKVQGIVILGVTVAPDGSIAEAWVERGIPLLDEAALDAVRQWKYSPTLMNGVPVPVRMTVTVNFALTEG